MGRRLIFSALTLWITYRSRSWLPHFAGGCLEREVSARHHMV